MDEQRIREIIRQELESLIKSDRFVFEKPIQILDGRNIQLGRSNGTQIGTATDQKISFYGVAPVVQAAAISAPSGGGTVDSQARTAINSILTVLINMGITA